MFFTSYEFIGFFLLLLVLYYSIPGKWQWILLLLGSYCFYYAANPQYLYYIMATTLVTYAVARSIGLNYAQQKAYLKKHKLALERDEKKAYKNTQSKIRRRWLVLCLVLVLGILVVAKYANFFIANLNEILGIFGKTQPLPLFKLILPLGISFYTFQSLGYLIDVYREKIPAERNLLRYGLFISFFPQLIQGPISRFEDLSSSLWEEHRFCGANVRNGLLRMLWGYFKKLVVADRILIAVSLLLGDTDTYHGAYICIAMIFYTVELYADFTGGIDITIGIAQTLGIQVKENFMRPYFSKSLKEYWRRWHISMSTWFKDYLFYPVSVSKAMQSITKVTRAHFGERAGRHLPVHMASLVVWLATGIWHGASWNFVVWGLLNWAILMLSEELEPLYEQFHQRFPVKGQWGFKVFQVGRTFILICVLNLFDCYESVSTTLHMLLSIFGAQNWGIITDGSLLMIGLTMSDYGILLAGVLIMFYVSLWQRRGCVREQIAKWYYPFQAAIWCGLLLVVLICGIYGTGYDSSQFIYNRF